MCQHLLSMFTGIVSITSVLTFLRDVYPIQHSVPNFKPFTGFSKDGDVLGMVNDCAKQKVDAL